MQLGIFAKTFHETGASPVLSAVSKAGFEVAQFNLACLGLPSMPDALDSAVAEEVGEASRTSGVEIAAISATYNMIHPDVTVRAKGLQRLEVIAQNCSAIGTSLITLCTGTRDPNDQWRWHPDNGSESAWSDLRQEIEKAVRVADIYDVYLGIEPELANVVSDAATARRLLDQAGSRRLRIVLDPANLFERVDQGERRRIIEQAIDVLGPEIALAHAKDRNANGEFVAAGKGVIEFDHFTKRLSAVGFGGPLVTHGLDASEASEVARFLKETLSEAGLS